jgi:predicted RNase H-like nuclease (RuvC/YqgF family)
MKVHLALSAAAGVHAFRLSPISRVVELLNGLADKTESDMKKAESMYEDFVCWGKTIVNSKTESNEKAKSRIDSLETYISDLDAGRIELTSERVDLEKELASLNSDIETAKSLREKEEKDFEAASDEMKMAISALEDAVEVLKEATKDHQDGSLIALRGRMSGGFSVRLAEASKLSHAVDVGRRFLSEGDALFLQRILTGEVPDKDWKKLNRKATFKMSYKARSGKIQGVLGKLLASFKKSLKEAEDKEDDAKDEYDKLMSSKKEQREKAENALSSMSVEGGARSMSKSQAQDEVDDLKDQVRNDERFISETETALEDKKDEWKTRKGLMVGEIAAINKAISILHSDDSRDLFKKSFKSQGYDFLQTRSDSTEAQRLGLAVGTIKKAAKGDRRMLAMAARLSLTSGGHFDEVISAIDDMITKLKDEEQEDLSNKEHCEEDRMDDTRDAIVDSRAIDDLSESIDRLVGEIEELKTEVKEKEKEVEDIKEEIKKAEKIRDDENAAWVKSNDDDTKAAELVDDAKGVLERFYQDNDLNLIQTSGKSQEPPKVVAGEAPPPPPATWEEPYGGQKGESQGIISILEMIHDDINKDKDKAKDEEDKAQQEFDDFKSDSEKEIDDLEDTITDMENSISDKEDDVSSKKGERGDKKDSLDSLLSKIKDEQPGCDFLLVNFEVRTENRQIEIDGLDKAKAILNGAEFDE